MNIESISAILDRHAGSAGSMAVQCGHFLVYYDHTEDVLLPCVREELGSPRHAVIANTVGAFPLLTWLLGLELLRATDCSRKAVLAVVNDWQYIPDTVDRAAFFKKNLTLFPSYAQSLNSYNDIALLTQRELGFKVQTGVWFSEVSLRNQYKRQFLKMIKKGSLPPLAEIAMNGNEMICSLLDALGSRREVYCTGKRPTCTQEIAELSRQICLVGKFDLFVNIYPLVCRQYVQSGTDLFFDLFGPTDAIVINIGMPSSDVNGFPDLFASNEVTIHTLKP